MSKINRHLQLVILSIAKDIDFLCRENGIKYYLIGGSAIGAIRHKGFIPWDDDLDIIMDAANYDKFISVCRTKLDNNKYYFQEGIKDWPLPFTKVKLRGTHLKEIEGIGDSDTDGIYMDIFKMDNVSNNPIVARWQYFCGKLFLTYQLSVRTYKSASLKKRILMALSFPLKSDKIRGWVLKQTTKYNDKDTNSYGFFFGRTRYHNSVVRKKLYGEPLYVPFEDTMLPVPEHYHEYLTQMFGDYMVLPPVEQRKGLHLIDVDFGGY